MRTRRGSTTQPQRRERVVSDHLYDELTMYYEERECELQEQLDAAQARVAELERLTAEGAKYRFALEAIANAKSGGTREQMITVARETIKNTDDE